MGVSEPIESRTSVRIDKWLWAVRVYKTRTLAAEACKSGHVKIEGKSVKAAREVRAGELILARAGEILRTLRVVGPVEKRVAAKLVDQFMEDLTPEEERNKPRGPKVRALFQRGRGEGRPTKRDRRVLTVLSRKLDEATED